MRTTLRAGAAGALLVLAFSTGACGPEESSPTFPSAPSGPSQADVVVTASTPTVGLSPRSGFSYRILIPVTIRETAGLGANIDSMRLSMVAGGRTVETQEIGSGDVIAVTGTNRLEGGATRSFTLTFDVNAGQATSAVLTLFFTDDRRNRLSAEFTITF